MTYYRNGHVGCKAHVRSESAKPMESYEIIGNTLRGPVSAEIKPNGDIVYSHGYTSRKEVIFTSLEGRRLILVQKDSKNAVKFPAQLSDPGTQTTLRLQNGVAIAPCFDGYRDFHGYKYIELKATEDLNKAFSARFDGSCVLMDFKGLTFAFDLSFGKHHEGNTCNFVVDREPKNTTNVGQNKGRHFVLNKDMTISPKHAQHLVLGL